MAFILLLVALLAVLLLSASLQLPASVVLFTLAGMLAFLLLFPASLLLPTSEADLFALAGAGILVIVCRTAGGFAVSSVSANACASSGSVPLFGC